MPDRPLHPVELKPASSIRSWRDWPPDIVETLRWWNGRHGAHKLSFRGWQVFKCPDCEWFCEPQKYGNASLGGVDICDECLIERARTAQRECEHDWQYLERKPGEDYVGYCEQCPNCRAIQQIPQ